MISIIVGLSVFWYVSIGFGVKKLLKKTDDPLSRLWAVPLLWPFALAVIAYYEGAS